MVSWFTWRSQTYLFKIGNGLELLLLFQFFFKWIVFYYKIYLLQKENINLNAIWKLLPQSHLLSQIINAFLMQIFSIVWEICCFLVYVYLANHISGPYYTCILILLSMPRISFLLNKGSSYGPFWNSFFFLAHFVGILLFILKFV